MLFKLSCLIGIAIALADGSTTLFWALAGVIVTISEKMMRLVLWFVVFVGGPLLLVRGETVSAIIGWPYAAINLGYLLLLDRTDKDSNAYRYLSALGWLTLALLGWIISVWLLASLIEDPFVRQAPVQYLIAALPAALAASYYAVHLIQPGAKLRTRQRAPATLAPRRRQRSEPAES
jgi:hypothetical protein